MNRWILGIAILGIALSPHNGSGAVISHDWKTPGDGLLTYDDVNQREWLDLSQTLLNQFPGSNILQRYQNVISELGAGGVFQGFAAATRGDVSALAISAGIDTTTADFPTNGAPISQLGEKRGQVHIINGPVPFITPCAPSFSIHRERGSPLFF